MVEFVVDVERRRGTTRVSGNIDPDMCTTGAKDAYTALDIGIG